MAGLRVKRLCSSSDRDVGFHGEDEVSAARMSVNNHHNPIPGFYSNDDQASPSKAPLQSKRHHGRALVYDGGAGGSLPGYYYGTNGRSGVVSAIVHYITHIRLSRLIGVVLLILICIPLLTHYYLSNMGTETDTVDTHRSRRVNTLRVDELPTVKLNDLKFRIDELNKIKLSVTNELKDLEMKRQRFLAEISGYNSHIDKLKQDYEAASKELQQLKISMEHSRLEQEEIVKRNTPELHAPRRILPGLSDDVIIPGPKSPYMCRMHNCFDLSRCSVTSQFPVYFYDPVEQQFATADIETFVRGSVVRALNSSPHFSFDPLSACVYIVLLGDLETTAGRSPPVYVNLQQKLHNLPHWHGDGRNHVLLNLARNYSNKDIFDGLNTGRAVVVQSSFTELQYRNGFDVVVPPLLGASHGEVWSQLPPQVPAKRAHLLSFQGKLQVLKELLRRESDPPGEPSGTMAQPLGRSNIHDLINFERTIVDTLKRMQSIYRDDGFHFEFSCEQERILGLNGEWALCGPETQRHHLLRESTFSLILAPINASIVSTTLTQTRIFEALKYGAIPVILGDNIKLPFEEILNWKDAVIVLPKARITELHFYLRSLADSDILALRRQGRVFWETYLGSTQSVINTLLATIRTRLHIPAYPTREEPSPSVFNDTNQPLVEDVVGNVSFIIVQTKLKVACILLKLICLREEKSRVLLSLGMSWRCSHLLLTMSTPQWYLPQGWMARH